MTKRLVFCPYLSVKRGSAGHRELVGAVGEVDLDRQDGDVEVQQDGPVQTRVRGVVDPVLQKRAPVLRHQQVSLQDQL